MVNAVNTEGKPDCLFSKQEALILGHSSVLIPLFPFCQKNEGQQTESILACSRFAGVGGDLSRWLCCSGNVLLRTAAHGLDSQLLTLTWLSDGIRAAMGNAAIERLSQSALQNNLAMIVLFMKANLLSETSLCIFWLAGAYDVRLFWWITSLFQHCNSRNKDFMFQHISFTSIAIQTAKLFPFWTSVPICLLSFVKLLWGEILFPGI